VPLHGQFYLTLLSKLFYNHQHPKGKASKKSNWALSPKLDEKGM
jgi:hypothetical protein